MREKNQPNQFYMTQQEVADVLGTSRANVADIEKKAKKKIRRILAKRNLKFNDMVWSV